MSESKIISLDDFRNKEVAELLAYLQKRLAENDLPGLYVQEINRRGKERIYLTGVYKRAPEKAIGAALMRITAAARADDSPPS